MIEWSCHKAKKYLHELGLQHIRDGLSQEGADLIREANFRYYSDIIDKKLFMDIIYRICRWQNKDLESAAKEAMLAAFQ